LSLFGDIFVPLGTSLENKDKCTNKNIPIRTNKEYREDNKEKIQQYRQENNKNVKRKH
jgi:hypothetical protein